MSNYQGRLSSRQLTIFIYFYSHWHFFNIFVTIWQPWAIISLRQNSGHTVILKISYSSTENIKKISKLKICLAGPSDPSETISSDLIKVCCLSNEIAEFPFSPSWAQLWIVKTKLSSSWLVLFRDFKTELDFSYCFNVLSIWTHLSFV